MQADVRRGSTYSTTVKLCGHLPIPTVFVYVCLFSCSRNLCVCGVVVTTQWRMKLLKSGACDPRAAHQFPPFLIILLFRELSPGQTLDISILHIGWELSL
jgi:hypothetical protein